MNSTIKGLIFALIAAVSYGTNPLFSLPLYDEGMNTDSILFYRYIFAVVILGVMLKIKGQTLRISRKEILPLFVLGILFSASSLFLYESFMYMDAGIACTILFVYPIMVAVIMFVVFREKTSLLTCICILMALSGIALLYQGDGATSLSTVGMIFVILSALSYAIYMVTVNKSSVARMPISRLTFYGLLFGMLLFVVRLRFLIDLQPLQSVFSWGYAFGMALFPTIISLVCIAVAIHNIGSTLTAIIGAMEPVTALVIGVTVFGESITPRIILGVLLILTAVTLIVVAEPLKNKFNKVLNFRHRHKSVG